MTIRRFVNLIIAFMILSISQVGAAANPERPPKLAELLKERKYKDAIPLALDYNKIALERFSAAPLVYVDASRLLAELYRYNRNYREAAQVSQEALDRIAGSPLADSETKSNLLVDLAEARRALGETNEAIAKYEAAWSQESGSRRYGAAAERSVDQLFIFYMNAGDYNKIERMILAAQELAQSPHAVGSLYMMLGNLLQSKRNIPEAQRSFERAYKIQAALPKQRDQDIETSFTLGALGTVYMQQGEFRKAEKALRDSLELRSQHLSKSSEEVALALDYLGEFYRTTGNEKKAESFYTQALKTALNGSNYQLFSTVAVDLGNSLLRQKRFGASKEVLQAALDASKGYGESSPESLGALQGLSLASAGLKLWAEAERFSHRATALVIQRSNTSGAFEDYRGLEEAKLNGGDIFAQHIVTLFNGTNRVSSISESFELAQWASQNDASLALSQLGRRFAEGGDTFSELIRQSQDLQTRRRQIEDTLARGGADRDALGVELRDLDSKISESDKKIREENPRAYQLFSTQTIISVENARKLLSEDEALLMFSVPAQDWVTQDIFVWAVYKEAAPEWFRLKISAPELDQMIQRLRCGLDDSEWSRKDKACLKVGMKAQGAETEMLRFDTSSAHELYKLIFAQLPAQISKKQLIIVPSGSLSRIPFQVLVTKPPLKQPATFDDYRKISWLGATQALTVLPSVSSLIALRGFAKTSKAKRTYLAYGDPLVNGNCGDFRQPDGSCSSSNILALQQKRKAYSVLRASRSQTIFDPKPEQLLEQVRGMCALPETAIEIKCTSEAFSDPDVRIGPKATEADIRELDSKGLLENYRIVHFATHGVRAGELSSVGSKGGEAALIMSPPPAGGPIVENDDGRLTTSEISQLRFDADWIVLSACNTSASEDLKGDEYSGLARAFLYAGARSVLVSHWSVDSSLASSLIRNIFSYATAGQPTAVAVQHAIAAQLNDLQDPRGAHPAYWAPFSLVGDASIAHAQ